MLLMVLLIAFVIAPVLFALTGWLRAGTPSESAAPQSFSWSLILASALCCAIAFNLTFFIQEIGLVLPKALTPGLTPVLFHNDHRWDGEHELAYLFQGTGALATLLSGLLSFYLVRSNRLQSLGSRLFFLWMAYHGVFMALPQFVIGAVNPYNDVGMAMDYFNLTAGGKMAWALAALIAMPLLAILLTRPFLMLAHEQAAISSRRSRFRFIAQVVTLPALIALFLIIPYRVPREWIEVIILPVVVLLVGTVWIQAYVWRTTTASVVPSLRPLSLKWLALSALVLLLVFQLVLRPGITFAMPGAFAQQHRTKVIIKSEDIDLLYRTYDNADRQPTAEQLP